MRVIYLAHPLGAPTPEGVAANLTRVKRWYRWIVTNFPNVAVVAAWVTTAEVLDDHNPEHRAHGMKMNGFVLVRCDEIWLVGGRISTGMASELESATEHGLRVYDLTWLGEEPPVEIPDNVMDLCA
jgi:hypothetical protein